MIPGKTHEDIQNRHKGLHDPSGGRQRDRNELHWIRFIQRGVLCTLAFLMIWSEPVRVFLKLELPGS